MDQFRKKTINEEGRKRKVKKILCGIFGKKIQGYNNIFRPAILVHFQITGVTVLAFAKNAFTRVRNIHIGWKAVPDSNWSR